MPSALRPTTRPPPTSRRCSAKRGIRRGICSRGIFWAKNGSSAGRGRGARKNARLRARQLGQTVVSASSRLSRLDNRAGSVGHASVETTGCVRHASYGDEPKLPLARLSARPRGRSGWRARIARPAPRRLPLRRAFCFTRAPPRPALRRNQSTRPSSQSRLAASRPRPSLARVSGRSRFPRTPNP